MQFRQGLPGEDRLECVIEVAKTLSPGPLARRDTILARQHTVHKHSAKNGQADWQAKAQAREQARREAGAIRFVVDQSDRKLCVFRGDELIGVYDVAVGMPKYPTPIGVWTFKRVDINPKWNPPDSPWAARRHPEPPGDPGNPMGQARLVFSMPYTIHGTDKLDSLGKASSHGSIRVSNAVVLDLAKLLLRAGGAWDSEQRFHQMANNRRKEYRIELLYPVLIAVVE